MRVDRAHSASCVRARRLVQEDRRSTNRCFHGCVALNASSHSIDQVGDSSAAPRTRSLLAEFDQGYTLLLVAVRFVDSFLGPVSARRSVSCACFSLSINAFCNQAALCPFSRTTHRSGAQSFSDRLRCSNALCRARRVRLEQREGKNKKLYANSRTLGTACIRQYDSRFASPRRARPLHNPSAHLNSGRGRGAGRRRAIWSRRVAKTHKKAQNRKNHQVHLRTCRAQVKLSPARFDGNSTSTYPTCSLHWSLLAGRHAWEKRVKKVKRRRRARNGSQNTSF